MSAYAKFGAKVTLARKRWIKSNHFRATRTGRRMNLSAASGHPDMKADQAGDVIQWHPVQKGHPRSKLSSNRSGRMAQRLRWLSMTPFGTPVLPDVNMRSATSSVEPCHFLSG
jgi:hypothetical protein